MNKIIFVIFLKIIASTAYAQKSVFHHLDEANRLISKRDCSGAELYSRNNLQSPMIFTVLGMVQLDCRGNKREAVAYFKAAAKENEMLAIEQLMALGEIPPQPNSVNFDIKAKDDPLPRPPPYISPKITQQKPESQQIIIQQPLPMILGACIQDGGGLFCPNHPNTKIIPFKIR